MQKVTLTLALLLSLGLAEAQPPADDLDQLWSRADALELGADQSQPAFKEAQELLDRAAATPDRQAAMELLRQACQLLRPLQKEAPRVTPPEGPGTGSRDAPARPRDGNLQPPPPPGDGPGIPPDAPPELRRRLLQDRLRRVLEQRQPGSDAPQDQPPAVAPRRRDPLRQDGGPLSRLLEGLDPDLREQLTSLADETPPPALRERLRRLAELHRVNPDRARLEVEDLALSRRVEELARALRETRGDDAPDTEQVVPAREEELRQAVTRLFDLRMRKHELELQARDAELQDMQRLLQEDRDLLQARRQARDALIQERLDRLLQRPGARDW